jgi:hypothetical protein
MAVLALRFGVAALLYIATAVVWVSNSSGWQSIGVFGAAVVVGFMAVPAWIGAAALGRLIANEYLRVVLHPVLIVLLVVALVLVIGVMIMQTTFESFWRDTWPFAALLAVIALVDASIGFLLERRSAPTRPKP